MKYIYSLVISVDIYQREAVAVSNIVLLQGPVYQ